MKPMLHPPSPLHYITQADIHSYYSDLKLLLSSRACTILLKVYGEKKKYVSEDIFQKKQKSQSA